MAIVDNVFGFVDFEADESQREYMEHLLYRTYTTENGKNAIYPLDEWIALWEEYVNLEGNFKAPWKMNGVQTNEKELALVLSNLKVLSVEAPDLYKKVVNERFGAQFLFETAKVLSCMRSKRKSRQLMQTVIECVQETQWEEVSIEEFLDVWGRNVIFIPDNQKCIFITLWKKCFDKLLVLDMRSLDQRGFFNSYVMCGEDLFHWDVENGEFAINNLKTFLRLADGIEGMNVSAAEPFLQAIMDCEDKELVYLALSKNLIPMEKVKKMIAYAKEKGNLEMIPLLIMKQFGELSAIAE